MSSLSANFAPPEWDQILRAAMKNDSISIRRLVEEQGVSPSHSNAVKQSALHIAALWGNVEAVEELLRQNATINCQNTMTGATPLHCASQSLKGEKSRRLLCMEKLIAKGADVTMVDFFGNSAADYLIEDTDGGAAIAKKLGLLPSPPPIFDAIDTIQVEQVRKLVANNNNNNNQPTSSSSIEQVFMNETPFQHAFNLLLPDDDDNNENDSAAEKGADEGDTKERSQKLVEILQILLEAGANVNAVDGGSMKNPMDALENPVLSPLVRVCNALQIAYKSNDNDDTNQDNIEILENVCELLIQHKATVTSELEQSLFHTACRKNELRMVQFLIQTLKINPNIKGRQGMTAIQFAARGGKIDIVRYLLSLPNVDATIADDRNQTALDAAKVNNKQDIVALLEEFLQK